MKWLLTICAVAVSSFLCLALWRVGVLARDADVSVRASDAVLAHATQTLTDLDRTVIIVGATATNVEKASRAWEQSSKEQAASTTAALREVGDASVSVQRLVARTDANLNDSLLPGLASTVQQQNQSLLSSQEQLRVTLKSVQQRVDDPNITTSLEGLASTTEHLSEVAASGERTAKYYEKKLTTPVGFWRTLVSFILDNGYKVKALIP